MRVSASKKYRTKDELDVKLLSFEGRGAFPIIGYIHQDECPFAWDEYGRSYNGDSDSDLVEVVEEVRYKFAYLNKKSGLLHMTSDYYPRNTNYFQTFCKEEYEFYGPLEETGKKFLTKASGLSSECEPEDEE